MRNTFFRRHTVGIYFVVGSMVYVALEALVSFHWGNNFSPSQVLARWHQPGIAFLFHGGMWGDFLLLPFVMAWIIERHGKDWSARKIAYAFAAGLAATLGNHINLILHQTIPDPLGWQHEYWSALIGMHGIYMTTYMALVFLFYFGSTNVGIREAVVISALLGIHVLFGMHVPLGIVDLWTNWSWCPDTFLKPGVFGAEAVLWALLTWGSWRTAGWRAGVSVLGIGLCLAGVLSAIIYASP